MAEARKAVAEQVKFPPGYYATWSGQFEYMERAAAKMKIVIPVTLLIIFLLLYLNFRRLTETLIVMLSVPFALVGGVWLLWLLDYNLSVAVAVGFIALAGVAAETGVVMLIYLDHAWQDVQARCASAGRRPTAADLYDAIMDGAVERVRPKMMTVVAIMAGLLPIMWSTGTGSEVMRRIAAPMVGGMISSTVLTLLVIPAIYALVKQHSLVSAPGVQQNKFNFDTPANKGIEMKTLTLIIEPDPRCNSGMAQAATPEHDMSQHRQWPLRPALRPHRGWRDQGRERNSRQGTDRP